MWAAICNKCKEWVYINNDDGDGDGRSRNWQKIHIAGNPHEIKTVGHLVYVCSALNIAMVVMPAPCPAGADIH